MIVSEVDYYLVINKFKIEKNEERSSLSPARNLNNQKISNTDYPAQSKPKPIPTQWNMQSKNEVAFQPSREEILESNSAFVNNISSPVKAKRFEEMKKNEMDNRKQFDKSIYNQHQLTSKNSMNINVINHIIQEAKPDESKVSFKAKDDVQSDLIENNKEFGIQNSRRKKNLESVDKTFQTTFYAPEQKNRESSKLLNENIDSILSKLIILSTIIRL